MRHATKSVPSPLIAQLRRLCQARLTRWAVAICTFAVPVALVPMPAAADTCGTSVMAAVAHEDDSLLFLSGWPRKFVRGDQAASDRLAGCWRALIRWRSLARSAAVNFQLNGRAVWL